MYFMYNLKMAIIALETCSCTLCRKYFHSTNKYSCVRRVHTLYISYFIEHNRDDQPRDCITIDLSMVRSSEM